MGKVPKITILDGDGQPCPMTEDNISLEIVGKCINGVHVISLRDGTLKTALPIAEDNDCHYIHMFKVKDPNTGGMVIAEDTPNPRTGEKRYKTEATNDRIDGAGIASVKHPEHKKGAFLLKTPETPDGVLADPNDKRVCWIENASYRMDVLEEKDGVPLKFNEKPLGKQDVGSWADFLAVVNAHMGQKYAGKVIDLTSEQQRQIEVMQKKQAELDEREENIAVRERMAGEAKKNMAESKGKAKSLEASKNKNVPGAKVKAE